MRFHQLMLLSTLTVLGLSLSALASQNAPQTPPQNGQATAKPASAANTSQNPATVQAPPTQFVPITGAIEAPAQPTGISTSTVNYRSRVKPSHAPGKLHTGLKTPVQTLVAVRGQEDNTITGIGLVTGLNGTGDSGDFAKTLLQNFLRTQDVNLPVQQLSSKNIAVVMIEANVPSGHDPGRRLDCRVSAIGDAKSLYGGTLLMSELTDIQNQVVYATASGTVTVGGFSAEGSGASAQKNHVTVGVVSGGAKLEREVATTIVSEHGWIYLDVRVAHGSFGNVVRIAEAINGMFPGAAQVLPDGKSVKVRVPDDLPDSEHAAYLDALLRLEVTSDDYARVIVNERTGIIVMGGNVRLRPGAIAQGNLTVTIAESPEASQPGPQSGGTTERLDRTSIDVDEEVSGLVSIPGAVTLQEVVDVLNVLGTSPRDLISILQAMSQAGLLAAEIYSM